MSSDPKPVAYGRRVFLKNAATALAATTVVPLYARKMLEPGVSFAILSDLHYHWQNINQFTGYINLINELTVDMVILNGDNINDDGPNLLNGVRNWDLFEENYNRFYSEYLGMIKPGIKVYPVLGNHDPFFPDNRNMNIMHELIKDEKFMLHHRDLVKKCTQGRFDKEFYSWDEGNWHFITFPCGGTQYMKDLGIFSWLEADLDANRTKPVIVFNHAPVWSIGMTDSYFIDVYQKGMFMNLLSKHGNVKYVFAGHIHNSTKVSVRSARNYKGINFIVCPTHIYDQRPFGKDQKYEHEIKQQNHGFIIGYLQDDSAELYSILPDSTKIPYPQHFEEINYASNPVNFYPLAALPVMKKPDNLFNDKHLAGWYCNWVYNEETHPSHIREVSETIKQSGKTPLRLGLKGRTNVYADFQNISQTNSVYKYFNKPGRVRKTKFSASWFVNAFNFAETDLTKHPNPTGEILRPGRFRYSEFFNLGIITIGFVKDNLPVYQYELTFGRWEKAPNSRTETDRERSKYLKSIFDYGEWPHPANRKIVWQDTKLKQWDKLALDFSGEVEENLEYDRILVALTLSNDGLYGHEMEVFFDNIRIDS
jgi:predicted phosphodiesterase